MLRSFLFSLATVILALGAPLITLSSTNSKEVENYQLEATLNQSKIPEDDTFCPLDN